VDLLRVILKEPEWLFDLVDELTYLIQQRHFLPNLGLITLESMRELRGRIRLVSDVQGYHNVRVAKHFLLDHLIRDIPALELFLLVRVRVIGSANVGLERQDVPPDGLAGLIPDLINLNHEWLGFIKDCVAGALIQNHIWTGSLVSREVCHVVTDIHNELRPRLGGNTGSLVDKNIQYAYWTRAVVAGLSASLLNFVSCVKNLRVESHDVIMQVLLALN